MDLPNFWHCRRLFGGTLGGPQKGTPRIRRKTTVRRQMARTVRLDASHQLAAYLSQARPVDQQRRGFSHCGDQPPRAAREDRLHCAPQCDESDLRGCVEDDAFHGTSPHPRAPCQTSGHRRTARLCGLLAENTSGARRKVGARRPALLDPRLFRRESGAGTGTALAVTRHEPTDRDSWGVGGLMLDRQKLEVILQRRFTGATNQQIAAAANAIMGLSQEWEEVSDRNLNLDPTTRATAATSATWCESSIGARSSMCGAACPPEDDVRQLNGVEPLSSKGGHR